MILEIKRIRKSRKFVLFIVSIIHAQSNTYFGKFQHYKFYDQTFQFLCKSLVVQLVYYGQNIKVRCPIRKIINYLHVAIFIFEIFAFKSCFI